MRRVVVLLAYIWDIQEESAVWPKTKNGGYFVLGSCRVVGRVSQLHHSVGLQPKGKDRVFFLLILLNFKCTVEIFESSNGTLKPSWQISLECVLHNKGKIFRHECVLFSTIYIAGCGLTFVETYCCFFYFVSNSTCITTVQNKLCKLWANCIYICFCYDS